MTTLAVRELSYRTTANDLYNAFSIFGKIQEIRMPLNEMNENKGFAFIVFESRSNAQNAILGMKNFRMDGRVINVEFSRSNQ